MDKVVQKIGLGTVQFGIPYGISNKSGQTPASEVSSILRIAQENQIRFIDTASAYGNAEKVLGQNDLSSFKVVSKFLPPQKGKLVQAQLKQSLEHLQLSSLYGYLAHRPRHLAENLPIWEELRSLKEKKILKKIGVSLNEPDELERLLDKQIHPDIIQVPFNYLDRRFKDLMISMKENGCEIHSRSTFLQGLFFMNLDKLDPYFNDLIPLIMELQQNIDNLPGALLKFVLEQPFIDRVIIGVENRNQFIQNLESISTLSSLPELAKKIDESILIPSNWPS